MSAVDAEQAGRRVEEVLDRLAATGDEAVCEAAEELVRGLMDFYGAGLARIVGHLDGGSAGKKPPGGSLAALLGDELVASLLVLHDLHPEDSATRIVRAVDSLPQYALRIVEFDDTTATLRLRTSAGPGCGCASTGEEARQAVEDALACFAPEVRSVELLPPEPDREPALLQIGRAPGTRAPGAGTATGPAPAQAP
ncbi:hypothetical protein [Streptomyces sp. SP18CS02]|uniref:hypothetical protein n=1 Tax=Streptomyces sp. SP18CS02 TaxID=3002531 RepID=UPI002E75E7D8|nr:hypothetical protein [Streptomyces sp. SP18CS02]MEE1752098.1 hypothetical protein [Streptomyces sp. SP18CS02]